MNEEQFKQLLEGKSDDEKKVLTDLYQESQRNYNLKSEAFKERDELKSKLKAFEDDKQKQFEDLAKEQGKYKELYESVMPKVNKLEELEKENSAYKAKLEAIEEETRKELLERFPDGKKEIVKDLPIDKLRDLAKLEVENVPPTDKTKAFKKPNISNQNLTAEEKMQGLYK